LKNDLKDYTRQFVWIGLLDGRWKAEPSTQEIIEKLKDIDDESWVIRVEGTPLLRSLQVVCGYGQ